MKISLAWTEIYSPVASLLVSKGAKLLAHEYSIHTAEIEGIDVFGTPGCRGVVVAKVLETKPHPNSDHLNLVSVSLGGDDIRPIVCGASNVVNAQYVVLATVGSVLPGDFEIKSAKIRGEESQGMICSLDELGLSSERAAWILQLEEVFDTAYLESKLGTPFFELETSIPGIDGKEFRAKIADTIFEIDNKFITNRPDLFSVRGNAREFSALYTLPLQEGVVDSSNFKNTLEAKIESDKVLAYHLAKFEGISVAKTPFGMELMLRKSGQPVKFDLVDLTNYVMTEYCQPMHAFDADKVDGKVIVREAKDGEKLLALDGKEYALKAGDLVIADNSSILAIAWVIGGANSAIDENTKNAIFESATFDPVSVRMTAARIGCRTDASTRFEKSQDPLLAAKAMRRTFEILAFMEKKSVPDATFSYVNDAKIQHISIEVTHDFISTKLGRAIAEADTKRILETLGFTYTKKSDSAFVVGVPSWRATKDISIKEDIVEEVGRVYGYEAIAEAPIPGFFSIAKKNREVVAKNALMDAFVAEGFLEAYNYSFSNEEKNTKALLSSEIQSVKIINAVSSEFTLMRKNIVTSLLPVASENSKHTSAFSLFEIGKIHEKLGENDFVEALSAAGVSSGKTMKDLRIALDSVFTKLLPSEKISVKQGIVTEEFPYFHPGKSGRYETESGVTLAVFGGLHPEVLENFGLSEDALYFEIDMQVFLALYDAFKEPVYAEFSRFQTISRELNFVLDEKIPTGEIAELIASVDSRIRSVFVLDIYRDKVKVGENKKSVTFSFTIEDKEKTLEDSESLALQEKIISTLSKHGFELRK